MSNNTWTKTLANGATLIITEAMGLSDLSIIPDTTNGTNDGTLTGSNSSGAGNSDHILIQTVICLPSSGLISGWSIVAPTSGKLYLIGQEK